jgi:hypothetical protein
MGEAIISEWLRTKNCLVIFNRNAHRGKEFQTYGDIIVKPPHLDHHLLVELKIEQSNCHGNLFVETWSNRAWFTPGWLFTSKAEQLFYYFLEEDQLFVVGMHDLKSFIFQRNAENKLAVLSRYQEKPQAKYKQLNQTFGLCVPIGHLSDSVPIKRRSPKAELDAGRISSGAFPIDAKAKAPVTANH